MTFFTLDRLNRAIKPALGEQIVMSPSHKGSNCKLVHLAAIRTSNPGHRQNLLLFLLIITKVWTFSLTLGITDQVHYIEDIFILLKIAFC